MSFRYYQRHGLIERELYYLRRRIGRYYLRLWASNMVVFAARFFGPRGAFRAYRIAVALRPKGGLPL